MSVERVATQPNIDRGKILEFPQRQVPETVAERAMRLRTPSTDDYLKASMDSSPNQIRAYARRQE